jgi:hypothetical protein
MDLNKFILVALLFSYVIIYNFKFNALNSNKKTVLFLFIFWYLLYKQYCQIKGMVAGYEVYDDQYLINLIVWIFKVIGCYLILTRSDDEMVKRGIEWGLILGTIVLVLSAYYYDLLLHVNIDVRMLYEGKSGGYVRSAGLYAGHPTQVSALMSIMFGYFLSKYLSSKNLNLKLLNFLMMIVVSSSFIINSSRNGLIGCIAILIIFAIRERRKGKIVFLALLSASIMLILYKYGDTLFYRMNKDQFVYVLQYSRLHLLMVHIKELVMNPEYLIWGTLKPYYLNTHNTYLEILYYGGIIFLVIFLYINLKLYKNRVHAGFDLLYPMIGYLVPLAGNNNNVELYYILILGLAFSSVTTNGKFEPKA